jgi:peptidoglycan/xylan/chitin deacetylase (PgdA/CDA1 family)
MSIGGHTINHPILAQMLPEQQWQEISGCGERFKEELGEPMLYFSYPVGGLGSFNDDTRACLEKAGVRYAFSYYGGFRRFDEWDKYDIRRIAVESYIGTDWFRAIVTLPQFFGRARG